MFEFQDSSSVEMHLVELLSGKYRNLMIVGDPDQNIYEWRGSDVRLLVDFDKDAAENFIGYVFLNQFLFRYARQKTGTIQNGKVRIL